MEPGRANLLTSLGFRPVICAAGLTATAVGAVFLFCRWPKETAEIGTQTDWETAEASTQAGWETADAVTQVLWGTAEASTQAGWETADAGTQAKRETVEAGVQAVRETVVSAIQAVWETAEVATQLHWADGLIQADLNAPQLVSGVNGQLQPAGWDVQTLHRSTMVFTWSWLFPCGPGMVGMRRCSGETVEGSLRTQFHFLSNVCFVLNAEGTYETQCTVDVATFIEWRSGDIVHAVSQRKEESRLLVVMDGVQVIQTSMTYKRVTISADGSVRRLERSETTLAPVFVVPDPSAAGPTASPGADASTAGDTQSSAQGSEDCCLMPEAREVPSLFNFCQSRRLGDFPTRLRALRQAFTILLRDQQQCNYVTVALRLTLSNLATLNGREVDLFQRAFDGLIAYVQNPENALSIQAELLEAGVHHINVLDIAFELVLFGIFERARPQLVSRVQGGFLEQLLAVVQCFLPSGAWSPAADRYQEMLRVDVAAFLEEVFSLELSDYSHLQTLADGLFSCLEHRVDQMLSRLPTP